MPHTYLSYTPGLIFCHLFSNPPAVNANDDQQALLSRTSLIAQVSSFGRMNNYQQAARHNLGAWRVLFGRAEHWVLALAVAHGGGCFWQGLLFIKIKK